MDDQEFIEIKKRHSEISPWPWTISLTGNIYGHVKDERDDPKRIGQIKGRGDRIFVMLAPEDVSNLIREVESLQKIIRNSGLIDATSKSEQKIEELEVKLIECLQEIDLWKSLLASYLPKK